MCKHMHVIIINLLCAAMLLVVIAACATAMTNDEKAGSDICSDYISSEFSVTDEENNAPADKIPDNAYTPTDATNDEDTSMAYAPYEKNQVPHNEEPCACSEWCEITHDQLREWTIEELGEIIVAAGTFWEDWWVRRDRFGWEHTGYWKDASEYNQYHPSNYVQLLPTSGFDNINDIRDYLLQLYTATWVDTWLTHEFSPFVEHNDMLYIHSIRICSVYPIWETATHTISNQVGCHAFVKSTVTFWWVEPYCEINGVTRSYYDATLYFAFVNGRINSTSYCPVFREPLSDAHEEARRFSLASS